MLLISQPKHLVRHAYGPLQNPYTLFHRRLHCQAGDAVSTNLFGCAWLHSCFHHTWDSLQ